MYLDERVSLEDHMEEVVVLDVLESCPCVCHVIYRLSGMSGLASNPANRQIASSYLGRWSTKIFFFH